MDIVSRLRRFMDAHSIAVTQFADTCGIPRPSLSQMLSGRNKKVSDEVIAKIHRGYPGLSMMWLLFGEGGMEAAGFRGGAPIGAATAQPAGMRGEPSYKPYPMGETPMPGLFTDGDTPASATMTGAQSAPYYNADDMGDTATVDSDGLFDTPKIIDAVPHGGAAGNDPSEQRRDSHAAAADGPTATFALAQSAGKRVVSIVVYYNDNSYESFVPSSPGLVI